MTDRTAPRDRGQETKMSTWQIESKAGVIYGEYEGETPEAAFAAMVDDMGGPAEDCDGNPLEGTPEDWFIREVETRGRAGR